MLKIDLHIHTTFSGHAYGSFYEVINEARRKKMKIIAITDHGPSMPGSASWIHFWMGGERVPKYKDLKILWGCEANLINGKSELDLEPRIQKKLDVLMFGVHYACPYKDLGIKKNTEAVISALKNPYVKIFTHPTNSRPDIDFEKVCRATLDNGVLLELNLAYLKKADKEKLILFKKMIDIVKANKKKLIVNSDAHFIHEIGDDAILKKHWKKLGLTKELIINNYPDELMKFLKK